MIEKRLGDQTSRSMFKEQAYKVSSNFSRALKLIRMKNVNLFVKAMLLLAFVVSSTFGYGQTLYDFNTPGQLSAYFNGSGTGASSVGQVTSGGINNSGSINVPGSANAIYTTKAAYTLVPVGSSATFESYIKSVGNSGYGGMGFTASTPANGVNSGAFRPEDALGISVHGGGFIFHNGSTNYSGSWGQGSSGSITAVKSSTCSDLINNNTTCGSPDKWFKVFFKITRSGQTIYDMRVEVWPANADGTLRFTTATAIFEVNGITNTTIQNATQVHSYFNFSGYRLSRFDNYGISLSGGAAFVPQPPSIATIDAVNNNNAFTVSANVVSDNGQAVTERGFVYSTNANPTVSDNKVVVGSGNGAFSDATPILSPGTYFFRAYATNSVGTSYGNELTRTIFGPIISTSGALNVFTACPSEDSASQSFTVSGADLTGNISMAALSGYEYSLCLVLKYGYRLKLILRC